VPVRGVVYLLALLAAFAVLGTVPPVSLAPWYLRQLVAPAVGAAILALLRVDGRTFHHAAQGYLRLLAGPRRVTGLRHRSPSGSKWRPEEILFVPDGSDHRLRAFRYAGPGAVLVQVPHRLARSERRRSGRPAASELVLTADDRPACGGEARVICLRAGTRLLVRGALRR
jgi:hypothetical protein